MGAWRSSVEHSARGGPVTAVVGLPILAYYARVEKSRRKKPSISAIVALAARPISFAGTLYASSRFDGHATIDKKFVLGSELAMMLR